MLTINQMLESFWQQMKEASEENDVLDILSWIAQTDLELNIDHGTLSLEQDFGKVNYWH